MRVVVDTNVVVSGLRTPRGNPGRVLVMVRAGLIKPVYDVRIMSEYMEVCARPRLRLDAGDVQQLVSDVFRLGTPVLYAPRAAFAGQADAIVTGNRRDFPDACGVRVLSPAELVALLAP